MSVSSPDLPINVVGSGLAGAMCALLLCESGYHVRLIESRPDFRLDHNETEPTATYLGKLTSASKRSINLALSHRGITALRAANLFDAIRPELIPMNGRIIHQSNGAVVVQPYGHDDQAIFSVSRTALNHRLLDKLDTMKNAETRFAVKCIGINADGHVLCADNTVLRGCMTVGADGAYSSVRESMRRLQRMDFSMSYISHGYKELCFPPAHTADGIAEWPMPNVNGLHIWPRHDFMLIALPNPDHSFTATFFAPFDILQRFDSAPDSAIRQFFAENFADALPLCADIESQWRSSPNSPLLTVRTSPWTYKDRVVIIGDAAHAVVPFYGQGMNAAFEDGLLLTETLNRYSGNITAALKDFNTVRCPAGHALADLSLDNWIEMQDKTASAAFLWRKRVESILHSMLGDGWIPLYSMVAFTRMQYDECVRRSRRQDHLINVVTAITAVSAVAAAIAGTYLLYRCRR